MTGVELVGAGSFLPRRAVTNERLVRAIPGWNAERITEKTGIEERRFLWDFDEKTGRALVPPADATMYPRGNTDMCEVALRRAMARANVSGADLDAIFLVTVSPDELNFSHDAVLLHERLGCREDATALVVDSGCGGALYLIDLAAKLIRGGGARTIAVVASTLTSAYLDREVFTSELPGNRRINAFLSMYLFGDGAGAVILRAGEEKLLASNVSTLHEKLVVRRGGGAMAPPHPGRATLADHAYIVDGPTVAETYPREMRRLVETLLLSHPEVEPARYYLHQSNRKLLEQLVVDLKLPPDRVPVHVHRYGNTSSASTLILLAEDLESRMVRIGSGEVILLAAVGAGVHAGGQLIRL